MREPVEGQSLTGMDDGGPGDREVKRKALIGSISKRLRPVCSKMPVAEFDAMVRDMADIELKYAHQTASTHVERAD